jgi:hypothetical protein
VAAAWNAAVCRGVLSGGSLAQIEPLIRSVPVTAPADAGLMTLLAFLRASLERERAYAARAWL